MKIETKYKFKEFLAKLGNAIIERPKAFIFFEHITDKVVAIHFLTTRRRLAATFAEYADEMLSLAKQKGYEVVLAHTPKKNVAAIAHEKEIGFKFFGETPTHYILGRVI